MRLPTQKTKPISKKKVNYTQLHLQIPFKGPVNRRFLQKLSRFAYLLNDFYCYLCYFRIYFRWSDRAHRVRARSQLILFGWKQSSSLQLTEAKPTAQVWRMPFMFLVKKKRVAFLPSPSLFDTARVFTQTPWLAYPNPLLSLVVHLPGLVNLTRWLGRVQFTDLNHLN